MEVVSDNSNIEVDTKAATETVIDVAHEIPEPLNKLSPQEKKVWKYLTHALDQYEIIHLTDTLTISIICKTFVDWINVEKELDEHRKKNKGIMVKTPNGFDQPHQLFFAARALKKELKDWLPEAVLTIPSFQKVMGERVTPKQKDLFEDPVARHRKNKAKIGMVVKDGGKE